MQQRRRCGYIVARIEIRRRQPLHEEEEAHAHPCRPR